MRTHECIRRVQLCAVLYCTVLTVLNCTALTVLFCSICTVLYVLYLYCSVHCIEDGGMIDGWRAAKFFRTVHVLYSTVLPGTVRTVQYGGQDGGGTQIRNDFFYKNNKK